MRKNLAKIIFSTFLISLAVSLWLSLLNSVTNPIQPFSTLESSDLSKEELAKSYENILLKVKDKDLILVQMSLSLIQNYYVDTQQFDFEKLFLASLENLKNHGDLTYRVHDSFIEIADEHQSKRIPRNWEDDEVKKIISIIEVADLIKDNHKDEKNQEDPIAETLGFVISSLDPYSKLLSEEDFKELKEGTEGEFGGLGIMVGVRNNLLTVIKLLPNSPAIRAGIRPMDHILSINGRSTFGITLEDLVKVMRGLPGTTAKLSFLRDGESSPFEVSMNREMVQIDPVTVRHIKTPKNNEALLLKLDTFSVKSYDRLRSEVEKSIGNKKSSLDGIIIDLRSNPGGLLEQAVKISKILVPDGSIVTVKGKETETEYAEHENLNIECPVVVLIDEDSASASEILAGALKDHDRALIIGQPSYGKGTVQSLFELPEGRALKLTIARYMTPSGESIQGTGVIPDIWLHPVYKQKSNKYLMGHYRYKIDGPFIGYNTKKKFKFDESITAYYLKDQESDPSKTKEVELALNLFDQYANVKGSENFQSSIFVNESKNKLKSKLQEWDKEASEYLKKKHIDWNQEKPDQDSHSLSILDYELGAYNVYVGAPVKMSFSILNNSDTPYSRVSVFVRASHRDMDTAEKLIGYVKASHLLQDTIEFEIPSYWLPGKTQFQVGIAVNGVEIEETLRDFKLRILERNEPVLRVSSNVEGTVKAGQTSKLTIFIKNESDRSVALDAVKLTNLSGKQVSAKFEVPVESHLLEPHQERAYKVEITGSKQILSSKLNFGVSVESHELKNTIHKVVYANAVP